MDKSYYVYAHFINESDERPFYIGKGTGGRAYSKNGRNNKWKEFSKKGMFVKILQDGMTENEAYNLETKLISEYGRLGEHDGCLTNITPGGGEATRPVPTWLEEYIKKSMFEKALNDYVTERNK